MPHLVSVHAALPRWRGTPGDPADKPWLSAFVKDAVAGRVAARKHQLDGDGQADLRFHGGPDKALLAYSADHYPLWRDELAMPEVGPGGFGENLCVEGLWEETVCLGDTYRIGTATFEVSQPRQPCWKLARRWNVKDLPARVVRNHRCGWYLRVVEEGTVAAGDAVELLSRPCPDWTVARAADTFHHAKKDAEATAALLAVGPLAESWKDELRDRLAKLTPAASP